MFCHGASLRTTLDTVKCWMWCVSAVLEGTLPSPAWGRGVVKEGFLEEGSKHHAWHIVGAR